ncbi:MAG: helix-turn-helix domain-containing protein [Vallitalea sp.]|nr:helix-turn-helix domain-containing protein [Vallitalea sp.]
MDWVLIGGKIREVRQSRGLFQSDMAKILGISQPCYSCYESGKKSISFGKLKKICQVLDIDIDEF